MDKEPTVAELEQVYDELASAIDQAGERSELFLTKLAMLLARETGHTARVTACIVAALDDL